MSSDWKQLRWLIGGVVVAAAIAIPAYLITLQPEDDKGTEATPASTDSPPEPTEAPSVPAELTEGLAPTVAHSLAVAVAAIPIAAAPSAESGRADFEDRKLGISVSWPPGWTRSTREGAVAVRSPERELVITISSPGPAADSKLIREQAIDAVKGTYAKPEVVRGQDRTIGGLKASGALITGKLSGSGRQQVLLAVARGEKRAYLVEVISTPTVPATTLAAAQSVLDSIELTR